MRNLPANLILEKNKLDGQEAWLILLDITMPNGDKFYFVRNTEDLVWNNQNYVAVPFSLNVKKEDGKGTIPELELSVPNEHRLFQGYLEAYDGAIDSTILLRVISAANLMEDYTELELTFSVLASAANSETIAFTIGPPNPLKQRFPKGRYIANHCNWQFRGVECAYAGADLTCERTLDACTAKFNSIRFGGFPGLDRIGVKLV